MQSSRPCLILACLFFSAMTAQATIRMVPSQYAKIQHAVDLAGDGDTIQLAPMTYNGVDNLDVKIRNKGLTIMGVGDPSQVVLDASGEAYHRGFLVFDTPTTTRLENLTIYGGIGSDEDSVYRWSAGGIWVQNSEMAIKNCRLISNLSVSLGGGIYAEHVTLTVENCIFDYCYSQYGGAIYCDANSICTLRNSKIQHCGGSSMGGGVMAEYSILTIENCDFDSNSTRYGFMDTGGYGGAVSAWNETTVSIKDSRFHFNKAYYRGGAVHTDGSYLTVSGSLFLGSRVTYRVPEGIGLQPGEGAAISVSAGSCQIDSSTIVGSYTQKSKSAVLINFAAAGIANTIIANSDSAYAFEGAATFTCSDIFGNEFGDWTGNIASQLGQNGNVSADPQFCLAFPGDYRVALGSPCDPAVSGCGLLIGSEPAGCDVVCGDADFSGRVSISDAVFLIRYIFANGDPPLVLLSGDVSCNGVVNISDVVYLINYIFASGAAPCAACP